MNKCIFKFKNISKLKCALLFLFGSIQNKRSTVTSYEVHKKELVVWRMLCINSTAEYTVSCYSRASGDKYLTQLVWIKLSRL